MTANFTQTSVGQLREILIQSGKFTKDQAEEIKGKAKLVEEVMKLQIESTPEDSLMNVFEKAVLQTEEVNVENESAVPDFNSPDWHDYVMTQFDVKELQDGKYPKVDGLRRVAQLLLGTIVESGPTQVNAPVEPNIPGRSTVVYLVVFDGPYGVIRFSSVAGSWIGNTDDEYAVFPEAIAETRAEARALRRALRLRVVSAEELTNKDAKETIRNINEKASDGEWKEDDSISSTQMTFIRKMCDKLGINLDKFIQLGKEKYESINDVPRSVALEMIQRLNEYQGTSQKSIAIPDEIKVG